MSRVGYVLTPTPSDVKPDGVLLLHGLYETPFSMRDMGEVLCQAGFYVTALLLPGHGTKPADLFTVTADDWIAAVDEAILTMRPTVNRLFVVGFSTGAMLALHRQLTTPTFDAMVLIAPPFKLTWPIKFAYALHKTLTWLGLSKGEWLTQRPELDVMKYASATTQSVKQIKGLAKQVDKQLQTRSPGCPLCCIVSLEDATVAAKPTLAFFNRFADRNSRLLLYARAPFTPPDGRYTVRTSFYPKERIHSLSHPAMVISPDNPHYGRSGEYTLASRVLDEPSVQFGEYGRWGTIVPLGQKTFRRLTFNPDFDGMMTEILSFLKRGAVGNALLPVDLAK